MQYLLFVGGLGLAALALLWLGLVIVGERESGLVVKRFGRELPPCRIVAVDG